ncbi:uncharacterized protein LODBEIA_P24190 [Lodderomyces beijingensis]|uniref:Uncharacterized protein n=1 Tax=Lodderomyces beijingensis TaxID=1775926 RepID=A0ABP0ZLW7_9ASCO
MASFAKSPVVLMLICFYFYFLPALVAQSPMSLEDNILPIFSSSTQYFGQSDPEIPRNKVNKTNFGLHEEYTWDSLLDALEPDEKLFFLQRHGEGWHNVARRLINASYSDWQCHWSIEDGKGDIEWFDAELTPRGHDQIAALSTKIRTNDGFPMPDKFYVSPLRRTLQTWQGTWSKMTDDTAVIKENAREKFGIDTESKRHSKSFIKKHFPDFEFESDFSDDDTSWENDKREKAQHCRFRAASLLEDIFEEAKDDEQVISIVLHSGIIYCLLNVVQHRTFVVPTGGMIPVVIKMEDTYKKYPLNDAFSDFDSWCPANLLTKVGASKEEVLNDAYIDYFDSEEDHAEKKKLFEAFIS